MWKVLFKQEMVGQNMEYTKDCPYPMEKIISPNSTNPLPNPRVSRGCCEDQPPPPGKANVDNVRVCVSLSQPLLITNCCNNPLSVTCNLWNDTSKIDLMKVYL